MKSIKIQNVHSYYSIHDKVWTNEMESEMLNWTWTFYFVSNNRMQIIIVNKYNAFSAIVCIVLFLWILDKVYLQIMLEFQMSGFLC